MNLYRVLLVLVCSAGCSGAFAAEKADEPVKLSLGPHLLIDDYLIADQSNLERRINEPKRLAEPLVTAREDHCFGPYVTVLQDPKTKRYRIWYDTPDATQFSDLAHMWSDDGMHWIRPTRILPDPEVAIEFSASVIDEGPDFPDTANRYKFGWYRAPGLRVAGSPDGFTWQMLSPKPVLKQDHDIISIFKDAAKGRYLAIGSTHTTGEGWQGRRRLPMQSVSTNLVDWEQPWVIFKPDAQDEGETQFYSMGGLIRRGELLIGMLRVLRDDLPAEAGGPRHGLGYTVLAWSRDGKTWQRDRAPFLPRNPKPGTWDRAMAWADYQLAVGDELYLYYGGYSHGHKDDRTKTRCIGMARFPRDRYVSRDAGQEAGSLRTRPLELDGSQLTVNADINGELTVRVVDEAGKPLDGFDRSDGEPISGDSLAHPIRWKGGSVAELKGKPVRLEFALRDARLYGLELRP